MKRLIFCFIILLFNNILQSKKYLVEVDDEKDVSNQENLASVEEVSEEFNEEDAMIESEGISNTIR